MKLFPPLVYAAALFTLPRHTSGAVVIDRSKSPSSDDSCISSRRRLQERYLELDDDGDGRYYENRRLFEVLGDSNMEEAVQQWLTNRTGALIRFGPIEAWDVSQVTTMYNLFKDAETFNDDISAWNVACVTTMHGMFWGAHTFNQNISRWNTMSVTNMYSMFRDAFSFNQDLSWPTGHVQGMGNMFSNATSMRGDLSLFDTSNVEDMGGMFSGCNYNRDISMWDVQNTEIMSKMFEFNPAFNQPIGKWETHSLQVFDRMFFNASSFQQSLCWEIQEVPSSSFQVFCNSGGRFNKWCVDKLIIYDANRRCIGPIEALIQDFTDFINDILEIWNDFVDFITRCFEQIGDFVCFAPEAMTRVENRGLVAMKDLQVGDKVLTGSGRYQPVYSMFHYDRTKPTPYLQIHTVRSHNATGARPLELTANHMLHVAGYENPIPAWQVQVGDYVYIMEPPRLTETKDPWTVSKRRPLLQVSQVVEIRQVVRHGLFNPLTEDGTIVVDDIVASAYASFLGTEHVRLFRTASTSSITTSSYVMQESSDDDDGWKVMSHQSFVHMLLAPYRAVCLHVYPHGCPPPDNGSDGSAWYGRLGQNLLILWLRQHVVIQAMIFAMLVTVFGFMNLILNPFGFSVALTLLGSCVLYRRTSLLREPQFAERRTCTGMGS